MLAAEHLCLRRHHDDGVSLTQSAQDASDQMMIQREQLPANYGGRR